jgi:hypothetical protein
MITNATKGIRDNIKIDSFYVIVGAVIAFTAATTTITSLVLYNTLPSYDYRAFAQEEDNDTIADTIDTNTTNPIT